MSIAGSLGVFFYAQKTKKDLTFSENFKSFPKNFLKFPKKDLNTNSEVPKRTKSGLVNYFTGQR